MLTALTIAMSWVVAATHVDASVLSARAVGAWHAGNAVIVGRAVCAGRTFVLTDSPDLAAIDAATGRTQVRRVTGMKAQDAAWGLGCTAGPALWTLASPHALVRLALDGRIAERVELALPRFALFGGADRLLFQQMPIAVGEPALHAGEPRQPSENRPWPGLVVRSSTSRAAQLAANLAVCGLAAGAEVPCWFADDTRLSISDGRASRFIDVAAAHGAGVDRAAPIHDAAVAGRTVWVLTTRAAPDAARLVGGRLALLDDRGVERAHLDLEPPARLIVAAGPSTCRLLTTGGDLLEVVQR